ncbi:hypothetical protein ASPZODRAFT_2117467 [Penicilliopsis zonata CBS 506.65]|uniref:Arrestin C-terminal-like domain-containing protein n=1 Tax=Penicilliopsis zonata CBS 506.65 TaxID=1073090 RepID=A0A1L9ST37_9EURO|nr:hypothetical protein ASPZODRAFT_2117467 [Penicilliopsis zonata CBS 506.65]OJJ50254.1 hypothetical protein ASPZODRAFT_2117467 [Penicilliopsis zonata CBS 506.65]
MDKNLHFELSQNTVFLKRNGSNCLSGTLVLCLGKPTRIRRAEVNLKGVFRRQPREWPVFNTSVSLLQTNILRPLYLSPGRHEFPFTIPLPLSRHMKETVEGVDGYAVFYRLKGSVAVSGKEISCSERIRIYHALELQTDDPVGVYNEWPQKIRYSIDTPSRYVPFGSTVPLEINLAPLTEGIQLESITVEMLEDQNLADEYFSNNSAERLVQSRRICERKFNSIKDLDFGNNNYYNNDYDNTDSDNGFCVSISLPTSLSAYSQDVMVGHLDISHRLIVTLFIRNDNHISSIRAAVPVVIYMPCANHVKDGIPPRYEDHMLDLPVDMSHLDRLPSYK